LDELLAEAKSLESLQYVLKFVENDFLHGLKSTMLKIKAAVFKKGIHARQTMAARKALF
jgi:hypothetical protein